MRQIKRKWLIGELRKQLRQANSEIGHLAAKHEMIMKEAQALKRYLLTFGGHRPSCARSKSGKLCTCSWSVVKEFVEQLG